VNGSDGLIRWLAGLSLALLACITGIVSYLHALSVVHMTGSRGLVAYLIPFVADLMIVTASLALLEAARNGGRKPRLAVLSLAVGIGSTVAFNVVAGLANSPGGALVASLPPVALVLSLETLMGLVRRARGGRASQPGTADDRCPHQVAATVDEAIVNAWQHQRDCLGEQPSQRRLATAFDIPRTKVAALVGSLNGQHPPDGGDPPPDQ
jgi:hypothetical protein